MSDRDHTYDFAESLRERDFRNVDNLLLENLIDDCLAENDLYLQEWGKDADKDDVITRLKEAYKALHKLKRRSKAWEKVDEILEVLIIDLGGEIDK